MNPFSQQQDAPMNLMDTSLARHSISESAPMGQGQLMGNHARKTRGDVELGMADIWLDDGGGAGGRRFAHRNPHNGTQKRQRILFWSLVPLVTIVLVSSIVHRARGGQTSSLAVAPTEAPLAANTTAPVPTLAPTGTEVGVEDQGGQGLDNLEGEGVEQGVDVNQEAVEDINQVVDLLDGDITEIKEAEANVTKEMEATEDEQTVVELQEEETVLEYEEQAALDEVEVMQQMNSVQTAQQVDLLSQEGDVLEKEMANLGETAELLDEEANAETPEEVEEASRQVGQLEDEETNLEGQQAAINEEVDQALQQDGGDGA